MSAGKTRFLTKNGYRFLTEEECLKVDNDDK
jgi:hypothetical protein